MTKPNPEIVSKWKADQQALKCDVLTSLGTPANRSTSELLAFYEAAQIAFDAWTPPDAFDVYRKCSFDIWERESQRAWHVMEATAVELATRWPDHIVERHELLAVLADWTGKCDDDPTIVAALLKLVQDSKHFREVAATRKAALLRREVLARQ